MTVQRIDAVELAAPVVDDGSGIVTVDAFVTRTGVFVYKRADGTVTRELRHPDDVFDTASMDTLRRKPVTNDHPRFGRVTRNNARYTTVGMSGDIVERIDERVRVPLTIFDADTIKAMRGDSKRRAREQTSCAYTCDTTPENGTYNGERYDHRQTGIRYNHIALVDQGRAGSSVRVRIDAEGAVAADIADVCYFDDGGDEEPRNDDATKRERTEMSKTKIKRDALTIGQYRSDVLQVEVTDDDVAAVESVLQRLDDAHKALADIDARADKIAGERDALRSERDGLKEKLDKAGAEPPVEVIQKLARDRAELLAIAGHMKIDGVDDVPNAEIRHRIVQTKFPDVKIDGLSIDNIQGRYDVIRESMRTELDNLDSLAALGNITRPGKDRKKTDAGQGEEPKSPRDLMIERMENAHKPKPASAPSN